MTANILIIDDEADIRDLLADIFEDEGYKIFKAAHSEQALALLDKHKIDLVVLDIWLDNSDMDGIQILKHIKQSNSFKLMPILMISGHGNVEMAVNAMKIGAFDYIEKPFKIDHILMTVERALEQKFLREENIRLKKSAIAHAMEGYDHYKSPAMVKIMKDMQMHCESDARVVITGEVGTGKIRYAKLLHQGSRRSDSPLSIVNANNFNTNEFKALMINAGEHGCVLLKSVHLMNLEQQNQLLSILNQDDLVARLITTCDTNIDSMIDRGLFSSALYDRLSVIRVDLPNLKNRTEDFDDLIEDCFKSVVAELDHKDAVNLPGLSNDFIIYLKSQSWPGNIRQLKLVIELEIYNLLSKSDQISSNPGHCNSHEKVNASIIANYVQVNMQDDPLIKDYKGYYQLPLKQAREQFEYDYLSYVFDKYDGHIANMARSIKMDRAALHRKLKSMTIISDKRVKN